MIEDRIEAVRAAFHRFGTIEATAQGSPIYERLCEVIEADEALLALASQAAPGQPVPNLFLGAVHAELLAAPQHPLAAYYPSAGGTRPIDSMLGHAFRDFVLEHREPIAELLRTRLVQTNEVRRSVGLLPAFAAVADAAGGAPLALFEVGPSAGLNLLFDRYRYDYSGLAAGDPTSPLLLRTELRGTLAPSEVRVPEVAVRWGIDLNALDVRSEADMGWLRALLWPEHADRRAVLDAAIEIAAHQPPEVVSGDLFERLPDAVSSAPREAVPVVFATFVLNQFSVEMRERLRALLLELSMAQTIHLVVVGYRDYFTPEIGDDGSAQIWLATLAHGVGSARRLGRMSAHGWWLEWAPEAARDW